jgi:hypothetical protein
VFPCPEEVLSDDAMVVGSIEGDTLTLDISHSGGCERHDYAVCFNPNFRESNPVQTDLVLIHDGHGDACEAFQEVTLTFDLTPLAEAYVAGYQTDSGLIITTYGLYSFGNLSCEEREMVASSTFYEGSDAADRSCETADDCRYTYTGPACFAHCGFVTSNDGAAALDELAETLDGGVCANYEAECGPVIVPPCLPPLELDCVSGQCSEVF